MPNEPPTSLQTRRTCASSSPRCSAARFCTMCGACVLRRGFQAFEMAEHADPRRDYFGKFLAGDDRDDSGYALCRLHVDGNDVGVRMRRTQIDDMAHPRQHHVADIESAALHQPV